MSESNINVTPGSGGPNIDLYTLDNGNSRQTISIGDPATGTKVASVDATLGLSVNPTALPPGASTSSKQPALGIAGTPSADVITIQGVTSMTPLKIDGSGVTQPVSAASLPLPIGAATAANQTNGTQVTSVNNFPVTQPISGTVAISGTIPVSGTFFQVTQPVSVSNQVQAQPCTLIISTVGVSAAAVTATLPAPGAGLSHYITQLDITRYATVVNAASATPITITTTNLPGSLAFTIDNGADPLGSVSVRQISFDSPMKSFTANTATTIVAPASTGVLWRINVWYYISV